jgi:hypothetical protein
MEMDEYGTREGGSGCDVMVRRAVETDGGGKDTTGRRGRAARRRREERATHPGVF